MLLQLKTPGSGAFKTYIQHDRPVLGSKFKGPNSLIDTVNQVTWSVGHTLTDNERLVQKALLNRKAPALKVDARMVLPKAVDSQIPLYGIDFVHA